MEIIPAIDLREGACARILGDVAASEAIASDDPLEQAIIFKELGAEWIHITDLDGAFSGRLCNLRVIQELVEMSGLNIEHSGGIRSMGHIDTLISLGVKRVVLGTAVLRNIDLTARVFAKHGDKVVPGVDGRDGMVAIEGFETSAATSVLKLLQDLKEIGFPRIIYTDLRRYGTLKGPNFERIEEMLAIDAMSMLIAGGINSYQAINRLKIMGAEGLIIGKALYTGAIDYKTAVTLA